MMTDERSDLDRTASEWAASIGSEFLWSSDIMIQGKLCTHPGIRFAFRLSDGRDFDVDILGTPALVGDAIAMGVLSWRLEVDRAFEAATEGER